MTGRLLSANKSEQDLKYKCFKVFLWPHNFWAAFAGHFRCQAKWASSGTWKSWALDLDLVTLLITKSDAGGRDRVTGQDRIVTQSARLAARSLATLSLFENQKGFNAFFNFGQWRHWRVTEDRFSSLFLMWNEIFNGVSSRELVTDQSSTYQFA